MSTIDLNVDNYNIDELKAILTLPNQLDNTNNSDISNFDTLYEMCNQFIQQYKSSGNQAMSTFFQDIQDKLVEYADAQTPTPQENQARQQQEWYENEYISQTDLTQKNKITDRKQKIDVFDNEHVPMNQQQLGVQNTTLVPVTQDSLNPTLKNITERFVNLDSQFRQAGMPETDYTLDLSDQLTNVLSMRLFAVEIPLTWYVIDKVYNNTCFWVTYNDVTTTLNSNILISIEAGNYNSATFVSALNDAFVLAGFSNSIVPVPWTPVTYNSINGKVTIDLSNTIFTSSYLNFTVTNENTFLTFYDVNGNLKCNFNCINQNYYLNQTLGWTMGYRQAIVSVNTQGGGNTAESILDLNGPRYLLLILDDFNQNHLNNGLVSITELSKTLKLPSYYSPDLPFSCVYSQKDISEEQVVLQKYQKSYGNYKQLIPSGPRTLTQSQLYTINEIIKNNEQTTNFMSKAPTTSDIFAVIPIKGGQTSFGMYVEFSGSLQDFKRIYFGPVHIDRMRVTLQDDKGNILNLNGCDWNFTLITENLYQY